MYYIQGRPAVGFPDIYWLFDREEDLSLEVGEDEVGMLDEGEGFPPQQGVLQLAAGEEEEGVKSTTTTGRAKFLDMSRFLRMKRRMTRTSGLVPLSSSSFLQDFFSRDGEKALWWLCFDL